MIDTTPMAWCVMCRSLEEVKNGHLCSVCGSYLEDHCVMHIASASRTDYRQGWVHGSEIELEAEE